VAWKKILVKAKDLMTTNGDSEIKDEIKYVSIDDVDIEYSGIYPDLTYQLNNVMNPDTNTEESSWNSGGHPTQWIQINLKNKMYVEAIELVVDISPSCEVVYNVDIDVKKKLDSQVAEVYEEFHSKEMWKKIPVGGVIKNIRVTTVKSESWVAWKRVLLKKPQREE